MVTDVVVTNATLGNSDGEATIIVTGGTAPYQFSLDNGATWQSSNSFAGLDAGVQILLVEDANGCSTIFCFIINEDPGCTIATTLFLNQPISCYGACDGALAYAYSEGAPNPPYTITLLNNGSPAITTTQTSSAFNGSFTNLCAGNYSISVTNGSGCLSFVSNYTLTQPSQINITVDVTNASTGNNNGVAEINATGGTGQYSYSLNGIDYQSSNTFDTLSAGVYIANVQDENGCSSILTFVVGENSNCNIVLTAFTTQAVSCSGFCNGVVGFAFNDVNTNPPYTVTLTNTSGGTNAQVFTIGNGGSGNFPNVCAGIYVVSVQDANGCQSFYTVQVTQPDYLQISATLVDATLGNSDGFATINVVGGTAPYQFSLDNGVTWQTSNILTGLGAGFYILTIQDANGCSTIFCFILGDTNVAAIVELTSGLSVYPNPTTGIIYVTSSSLQAFNLYDLSGKKLAVSQTQTSEQTSLDLSALANGMYILVAIDANGNVARTSVVKQ